MVDGQEHNAADPSNGWNAVAEQFVQVRRSSNIGAATVAEWSRQLPSGCAVLDLGCGFGLPVAKTLSDRGFELFGIDASPRLVAEFTQQLPHAQVRCEAVEHSAFFGRKFDGVVAVGLLFLLPPQTQLKLLARVASVLNEGGHFLFTAPQQVCSWQDLLTGRESLSLGKDAYVTAAQARGLTLCGEYEDEGENHYFSFFKRGAG